MTPDRLVKQAADLTRQAFSAENASDESLRAAAQLCYRAADLLHAAALAVEVDGWLSSRGRSLPAAAPLRALHEAGEDGA